jgi:hypothetical protein
MSVVGTTLKSSALQQSFDPAQRAGRGPAFDEVDGASQGIEVP